MKRIAMILLSFALLLACVPTPEEEFVVNKGEGTLEEIIHATAIPDSEPNGDVIEALPGATKAPAQATTAPEAPAVRTYSWKDSFSVPAAMDRLDVTVNAEVAVPESGVASVYRIGFAAPESDQMYRLMRTFFGDGDFFLADRTRTKAYYKAQMERCVAEKEKETDESIRQQWDYVLQRASKDYADAPDAQPPVVWDGLIGADGLDLMAENGDGTYRYLKMNATGIAYRDALDAPDVIEGNAVTAEIQTDEEAEAVRLAESILRDVGVDAAFRGIAPTEKSIKAFGERDVDGFMVYFEPLYGGLPVSDVRRFNGFDGAAEAAGVVDEPKYTVSYEAETITFLIANGEVVTFRYMRPSRILRTENKAAALLPFERVQELFRSYIGMVMYVNKGEPLGVDVHSVRLVMARCPIENNTDEFYLLPAWEFVASIRSGSDFIDSNLQNVCVLRINALDGSIVV